MIYYFSEDVVYKAAYFSLNGNQPRIYNCKFDNNYEQKRTPQWKPEPLNR